ncbi:MAG: tryptophan-rich sensory protein [Clostridia bacterium]|nr:tryptophan-rich sensory protein [Clostridia bacterium]
MENLSVFKKRLIIIVSIIVVAVLGSIFVNIGMDWYSTLNKPTQWVPDILIPIVWTIIYLAFAILLSIWIAKENISKTTIILLILNGIFNILWCLVFFTLKQTLGGNVIIIINLILSFLLINEIKKANKLFALILSIYPVWVCVATTLNNCIWILN